MSGTAVDEVQEQFAWGDRDRACASLIPGTVPHCKYALLSEIAAHGASQRAINLFAEWEQARERERTQYEDRDIFEIIRQRLLLLAYDNEATRQKAIDDIMTEFRISLDHSQVGQSELPPSTYPSELSADQTNQTKLLERVYSDRHLMVQPIALEQIDANLLSEQQFDRFVGMLNRPDHPKLVDYLVTHMNKNDGAQSFGSLPIHSMLTLDQLNILVEKLPALRNTRCFVEQYLQTLLPGDDVDLDADNLQMHSYLLNAKSFVDSLPPAFVSFQIMVYANLLQFLAHKLCKYDEDLFIKYVQLPKDTSTCLHSRFRSDVDLGSIRERIDNVALHSVIDDNSVNWDELLTVEYLDHFFAQPDRTTFKPYDQYLPDSYLRNRFAIAKLLSGSTEYLKTISDKQLVSRLRESVEVKFLPQNPKYFARTDPVALRVALKNVPFLRAKVFEMNTLNYLIDKGQEIPADINLDGLCACLELSFTYTQQPFIQHKEMIEIPQLAKQCGVFVVELIGNGVSCRAIIRKGWLGVDQRVAISGHVFRVVNENNLVLPDAAIWMADRRYDADKNGEINIPFAPSDGDRSRSIILIHENVCTMTTFRHLSEQYELRCAFAVDRESLISGNRNAQVLIRPGLFLQGNPVTTKLMTDTSVTVEIVDSEASTVTHREVVVSDTEELCVVFAVPEGLRSVDFTFSGKIQKMDKSVEEVTARNRVHDLNGINSTDCILDLHLRQTSCSTYELHVLGKTGEAKPNQVVLVQLYHRFFTDPIRVELQSDAAGIIRLGNLAKFDSVSAECGRASHSWPVPHDHCTLPSVVHAAQGSVIRIPFVDPYNHRMAPGSLSLLEVGRMPGSFLSCKTSHVHMTPDGFLEIKTLPAGTYSLALKCLSSIVTIEIRVTGVSAPALNLRTRDPLALHQHPLALVDNPYAAKGSQWKCDTCGLLGDTQVYNCMPCGFDLCTNCYKRLVLGQPICPQRLSILPTPRLQISSLSVKDHELHVKLSGVTPATRVHVRCPRMVSAGSTAFDTASALAEANKTTVPSVSTAQQTVSEYKTQIQLDEEQRYIIERQTAAHVPGNMLTRPSLLLVPTEIQETQTEQNRPFCSSVPRCAMERMMEQCMAAPARCMSPLCYAAAITSGSSSLDFLAQPVVFAVNQKPSADGTVTVNLDPLGAFAAGVAEVIAADDIGVVSKRVSVPLATQPPPRDLRQQAALDSAQHFAEQREVQSLVDGQSWTTSDASITRFTAYDTVQKAYELLAAILSGTSDAAKWKTFGFLQRWDRLDETQKRAKYAEYASHELNFFLYSKDREFFQRVVLPFVANKAQKTPVDNWFLRNDLSLQLLPGNFPEQNVFEQCLLAAAFKDTRGKGIADFLTSKSKARPLDASTRNRLFDTALKQASDDSQPTRLQSARTVHLETQSAQCQSVQYEFAPMMASEMEYDRGGYTHDGISRYDADMSRRGTAMRDQLYKPAGDAKEYGERGYYSTMPGRDVQVPSSAFWAEYATHVVAGGKTTFVPQNWHESCRSFTEAVLVLSLIDLPFVNESTETASGSSLTIAWKKPCTVFSKQIRMSTNKDTCEILVNQNYFDASNPYTTDADGERVDKYVTDEFVINNVYGCRVVLSNGSATSVKLNVLLQIPEGAVPVNSGFTTKNMHLQLSGYATQTVDYYFYFPRTGQYRCYPVHASRNGLLSGAARPTSFVVVETRREIDVRSWQHVADAGTDEQVLSFLKEENLCKIDVNRIAWRMKNKAFFVRSTDILRSRRIFSATLWGYGFLHNHLPAMQEYLSERKSFGPEFSCTLYKSPVTHYLHSEFWPVINARTHRLGQKKVLLNNRVAQQYNSLLRTLSFCARPSKEHLLAVVYFLLLQDRIDEARALMQRLSSASSLASAPSSCTLQQDYLTAYLAFFNADDEAGLASAETTARQYVDYPVTTWAKRFQEVLSQLQEIKSGVPSEFVTGSDTLAAKQPSLEMAIANNTVEITFANINEACAVRFYQMDIELLFSTTPFMAGETGQFVFVKPTQEIKVTLASAADKPVNKTQVPIPAAFANKNIMIEVAAAGLRRSEGYFAHSLNCQIFETHGQLHLTHKETGRPVATAYVKVYISRGDKGSFYKDGYTDLRGRFDYASLNTDGGFDGTSKFALLVMSDKFGSLVKEVKPPGSGR